MAPSLVYHGFIRALFALALNIMSVQLLLAAGKDKLTPGKSGTCFILLLFLFFFFIIIFFFSLYFCLLSIIINFGVGNLFNFVCLFVCFALLCYFCFCFVLIFDLFLFIFIIIIIILFCLVVFYCGCCCFCVCFVPRLLLLFLCVFLF